MTSRTSFSFYLKCAWPRLFLLLAICMATMATWKAFQSSAALVIGGSVLTLIGIPMTFGRLIQRGPAGVDDPDPPPTLPGPGPGVRLNDAHLWFGVKRTRDNFFVIDGILFLMVGTFMAGLLPALLEFLKH